MIDDMRNRNNQAEGVMRCIIKDKDISFHNKKLILRYQQEMFANGISARRITRKLFDLKGICDRWMERKKKLDELMIEDVKNIVAQIEMSSYAEYTKSGFKITLRSFVHWVRGGGPVPDEVAWYKTGVKKCRQKLPEDMLTEEEIEKMINVEQHPRQRALISLLYESGCRIGELLSIRLKHIAFDENGALILVNGKTGARRVRIIASVPYLLEWLNAHPRKDDPDAALWTRLKSDTPATYFMLRKLLSQTARKAGIKKKTNPHNFRHSRATALAKHLTEAQMKQYLGWVQGSEMAAIYVHLSSRDVDSALFRLYGMKTEANEDDTRLKPVKCYRCQEVNGFANKLCRRCGAVLRSSEDLVTQHIERSRADELLDKMLEDPGFKQIFVQKARELMEAKA